ncbi:uncharacterized protein CANTADRAFT_4346 [Suhomyces tanzawaensis NRRL Y-17324]|uniref:TUG ubiquitin-like domain-containing protein n=1 Tax=Suhomyces tanzawaensis NRRL Y-17324 TaxID=984487 RepID=A0A1E4SS48_9ASCO|nr:uncharacterized protein CANTADRAFT_4346 [Suhomyces tanzawaensis NRRL Y-17324]ODV82338.1 hypothetical protein CANTADRAFT_4346 [Suhomyces tanzawaensis NRRL Y-17324]
MSSISLNITHNFATKKVTFPKSATIHQVAEAALEKFGIRNGAVGQLLYNDKPLDSSLPLRLTNLTNNSKLKLVLRSGGGKGTPINVKLTISYPEESKTIIGKVDSSVTLHQLLEQFGSSNSIDLLSKQSQLVILNTTYNSADYQQKQLKAIVGNVSSMVIRMVFVKSQDENQKRQQEQKAIVERQLQLQRERNEKLRVEKLKEQEQQEQARAQAQEDEDVNMEDAIDESKEKQVGSTSNSSQSRPTTVVQKPTNETPGDSLIEQPEQDKFQETATESPQLYLPESRSTSSYENPDEDYEMTVSQAMTYQKLIQDSAKRKKKVVNVPQKYNLRIKFPDRSILQINLLQDVQSIKFGQLLKKIDELLLEEFVGKYHLKLGYPPFQKIQTSFDYNNTLLVKLPEFQSERSVFIWEYNGSEKKSGPFVKPGAIADIKTSSELPEVVLESHRGELPGDATTSEVKPVLGSTSSKDPKAKSGPKLPRWFKTK